MLRNSQVTAICLFVGLIVTSCSQTATSNPGLEIERESARRGDEAYKQYRTADYQTAKSALKDHLQFLDKLSSDSNAADSIRADAMITCVRLAKLEEKNHGSEQTFYMREAVTRCQTLKIKIGGCSEENLRKEVDRMDQIHPK